jgi:mannose-6-phosphate isomerase-like protein (cupin superfamily)
MADYTVTNLKAVEDMAPQYGLSPHIEARYARVPLELQQGGLSYFRLEPGFRVPFGHSHAEQEEVYLVVNGSLRVKLDDEIVELGPWDALRVPVNVTRNLEGGPEGAEYVAFGAPNTDNGDAELIPGWWAD